MVILFSRIHISALQEANLKPFHLTIYLRQDMAQPEMAGM
jgi:hypothetical protein